MFKTFVLSLYIIEDYGQACSFHQALVIRSGNRYWAWRTSLVSLLVYHNNYLL